MCKFLSVTLGPGGKNVPGETIEKLGEGGGKKKGVGEISRSAGCGQRVLVGVIR